MKKIGRPLKFGEPTVPISIRVPTSHYDRLCREAGGKNELAEYARQQLRVPSGLRNRK